MPVQGITQSDAAWSQAKFDGLKKQVEQGTVDRVHELHDQTSHAFQYIPKPKTESGPGGTAPNTFTFEWTSNLIRDVQASGYKALKIADAFFPFTYQGHLLNPAFHELDPAFGGQKVDFHL